MVVRVLLAGPGFREVIDVAILVSFQSDLVDLDLFTATRSSRTR